MDSAKDEKGHSIDIIYEDDNVLVINKPAGMLVHADGHSSGETVTDWFLEHVPSAKDVGEPMVLQDGTEISRPGVVHRLDRETSGVMVLAKTKEAHAYLKRQFHDRHVKKEYRAFVYGTMKEQYGTINRPIGRSASDPRKRSAMRGRKGRLRDAVTDWECISKNDKYTYLKLMPKTGRTHQLRVHLRSVDRPIVGDTLYASKGLLGMDDLGIGRLALHAHTLTLKLPGGSDQTFIARVPASFETAAASIADG